jgi:hypothetical protein
MKKKPKWTGGIAGFANISYEVKEKPVPALKIKYHFPIGEGISTNENSALIRPFRKILQDGKNPGKISYLFLKDHENHFILGGFSFTDNFLIFFPGTNDRRLVNFGEDQYLNQGKTFHIDHITLEKNLEKFHFKVEETSEQIKFPNWKTKTIDKNTILWFTLKIQSPDKLEKCPKELRITLYEAMNEIKRRLSVIEDARKKAIFPITQLKEEPQKPFFWYLEFFVSDNQDKSKVPRTPVTVMKNPDTDLLDNRTENETRTHQVFFDGFSGSVIVRISKQMGTIKHHSLYESGISIVPKEE